jgi:hypothetical protein
VRNDQWIFCWEWAILEDGVCVCVCVCARIKAVTCHIGYSDPDTRMLEQKPWYAFDCENLDSHTTLHRGHLRVGIDEDEDETPKE